MKPADVLPLLRRRWYIVLPGLLLAVAAVVGAWGFVGPQYERTGTQMLLPGAANLPEGSTNPFLFISGLQLPADVLVQSVGGPDGLAAILADFPDSEVVVERAAGSAPIVRTIVTSPSDAEAEELLSLVMAHSVSVLEEPHDRPREHPAAAHPHRRSRGHRHRRHRAHARAHRSRGRVRATQAACDDVG